MKTDSIPPVKGYIALGLIALAVVFGIINLMVKPKSAVVSPKEKSSMKNITFTKPGIAIVTIDEIITLERARSFFGEPTRSSAEMIADDFEAYANDERVKAIVLSVNSPGGTPAACEMIYKRMMTLKNRNKLPIVAHFREVAASGAYYISMPADKIVVSAGTITGSVGVIMYTINFSGLMEKFGVKYYGIVSGKSKDILSPYRKPSNDEIDYLNAMVYDVYTDFRDVVLQSRGEKLKGSPNVLLDGRVFSGRQAVRVGIADMIGTERDAIAEACKLAKLDPENPNIIVPQEHDNLFIRMRQALGSMVQGSMKSDTGIEQLITQKYSGIPMYMYLGHGGK
ncbi:MAG: signal peptide peptidase SppA [Spirochaetes bacterium]|nr:signal peptide peptidase SppA [Spirochaetota bacterium]